MLLDVLAAVGLEGMAQVDLDVHHNQHQPLLALSAMAYEVLLVIATRLEREGRLFELEPSPLLTADDALASSFAERPPILSLR